MCEKKMLNSYQKVFLASFETLVCFVNLTTLSSLPKNLEIHFNPFCLSLSFRIVYTIVILIISQSIRIAIAVFSQFAGFMSWAFPIHNAVTIHWNSRSIDNCCLFRCLLYYHNQWNSLHQFDSHAINIWWVTQWSVLIFKFKSSNEFPHQQQQQ